jgi:autotransporter-associated beta strand protein
MLTRCIRHRMSLQFFQNPSTQSHPVRFTFILLVSLMSFDPAFRTYAQSLYWDTDNTTPGSGGATPSGSWDLSLQRWNNPTGDATAAAWINTGLEQAIFAAGADATGTYGVSLGAGEAIKLSALTLNTGILTLAAAGASDSLDFGTVIAALQVAGGATLNLSTGISGTAGLTKSGTGNLILNSSTSPTGAYVINAGDLQVADGMTVNASALTLGGAAGVTSKLSLGTGAIFNLSGGITYSNVSTPLGALIQGGTLNLNGTRTITTQNIPTDPDLEITSVIADGSAASGLTKAGGGTLLLRGNNTYTGATILNAAGGNILVQGNQANIASSSSLTIGASAAVTLGSSSDNIAVNRLGDTADITVSGAAGGTASLSYQGSDFAVQAVHTEIVGVLTLGGSNRDLITLIPGVGDELVFSATSLLRSGKAVGLVRGSNLGSAAGTADSTRLILGTASTLTGGIIPWLLADASAAGNGTAFATYDNTLGIRPLNSSETVSPALASTGSNVLKSAVGAASVTSSLQANSWTVSNTGTTTLGSGVTLGITSGGMLFTATSTLTGGTLDLAGTNQGIIHLASSGAVTATINSVVTGNQGLIISGAGTGNKIVVLGSSNALTGDVAVYSGILQLNHMEALGPQGTNGLIVQAGGTVRLNGNAITITSLTGAGTVVNNSATLNSTLRVSAGGTFTGTLNNGAAGTLSLIKSGTTNLILQGNNAYTGTTVIEQGLVQLGNGGNGGRLSGTSSIALQQGTTLRVTNTNGANTISDRINDSATFTLHGSTFDFDATAAAGTDYSETAGAVSLVAGANQITADQAASGRTSTLIFAGLSRSEGSTVNFTGGVSGLGGSIQNRLDFGGLTAGFLGGGITTGNEFAKYVVDIDGVTGGNQGSVTTFTSADYSTLTELDWVNTLHVKPGADQTMTASREVHSVNLGNGLDLNLGANALNIQSGGLIKQAGTVDGTGTSRSQITGGTLTAGGSTAGAELFIRVTGANLNIDSTIVDNTGGQIHLVKSGVGTVVLTGNNSYTGKTYVNEGTLLANSLLGSSTGMGAVTVSAAAILGGRGSISGNTTVQGNLRPGDPALSGGRDTLTFGGNLSLAASSRTTLSLGTPTGSAASLISGDDWVGTIPSSLPSLLTGSITAGTHDHVEVTGTLNLASGGTIILDAAAYTIPAAGDVFNLLDWNSLVTNGFNFGARYQLGTEITQDLDLPELGNGFQWDTSLFASHGALVVVLVPEPSRVMLLFIGLGLGVLRRRRN